MSCPDENPRGEVSDGNETPQSVEDPRVIRRLQEYRVALEAGKKPDRHALLAEFPEIANEVRDCLDGLDFIHKAAPEFRSSDGGPPNDPPAETGAPLARFGDYQIVRQLGRGGMGVVYEAEQISLRRRVAIKVLPFAAVLDPRHVQRFKNEAQAAAALDHPNIVRIYAVGCERGVHYYAMQYVAGRTIAQVIKGLRNPPNPVGAHIGKGPDQAIGPARQVDLPQPEVSNAPEASREAPPSESPIGAVPRQDGRRHEELPTKTRIRNDWSPGNAAGEGDFQLVLRGFEQASSAADFPGLYAGEEQQSDQWPSGPPDEAELPTETSRTTPGGVASLPKTGRTRRIRLSTNGSRLPPGLFRWAADLGIQAADALEHAHQVGVVHRDIKPSNLIVDSQGHLWITDFGLAMTSQAAHLTAPGDVLGTVQYMSPEQVSGRSRVLDHRTDLYSLGATLYELLTLEPAFAGGSSHDMPRRILEEEPRAPRAINRAIPLDLETIVLKAMAKDPEKRYHSAAAMADDLRRFLRGDPVLASRPGIWQLAARWARRHRVYVVAALAVLLLAAAAAILASILVWRAQKRTAAALAESQANLGVARQVVDDMYIRVAQSWLAEQPKMTPLQRELLEKALGFYQTCAQKEPDNEEQLFDIAIAWLRYGELHNKLQRFPEAEIPIREAIRRLEELVRGQPQNREYRRALASAWLSMAGTLDETQVVRADSDAFLAYRSAYELRRAILQEDPLDSTSQLEYGQLCCELAPKLVIIGDYVEAETLLTQALELGRSLARDNPQSFPHLRIFTDALNGLAKLRRQQNRLDETARLYRETLPFAEAYLQLFPHSPTHQRGAASLYRDLASVLEQIGSDKEAESLFLKSVAIDEKVIADFPDVALFKKELGLDLWQLGALLSRRGERQAARTRFEPAVVNFRGGFAQNPLDLYGCVFLLECQQDLIDLLDGLGEHVEMRKVREQAIEDLGKVLETHPGKPAIAGSCGRLGYCLMSDPSPGCREPDRAMALAKIAIDLSPDEGAGWDVEGIVRYRSGNWEEARQSLLRAAELSSQAPPVRRSMRYSVRRLPQVAFYLVMTEAQLGNQGEARTWYQKALQFEEEATKHVSFSITAELDRLHEEAVSLVDR